ncbi:glycosyltransferase [Massilia sp. R2A-15]|uniref:glycosyltransferase n=1 Tax=Massilia sp. R2A-15 TaxID=3064278 RepID=UPI0027373893|nr:glycosyltransferase [Massilia sp. R2A-15]WLI88272.1 glycosyltransferase [Massilia sp. R2A-15]
MKAPSPTISIVINTLNRGPELQQTLDSLRWLKYSGQFEVVVVNGPSTDHSDDVIAAWSGQVRAGKCALANLSVSRNIGICMAQGDIVAFIDDDAIPEPEWLEQLAQAYADPMVGAAGGLVFNHTGYDFQYKYCVVDRFGNADVGMAGPTPHLSFPKSGRFPHLLGCNSSFRRSALLEVGGFDEEYEYFLDETDVCLRVVDAGYLIAQLPCAYVHHKYAPSNIRGENKVPRNRYPIIKNKIYFTLKHAREFHPLARVLQEHHNFVEGQRQEVNWAAGEKLLSEADVAQFNSDLDRALEVGLRRGFEGVLPGAMIDAAKLARYAGHFKPFTPIANPDAKAIVLVSRDFPPNHGGGIATFNKDLAEALARDGHIVCVITQSPDVNRVDFENGVWVHRMVVREVPRSQAAIDAALPQQLWNWSAVAFEEARRIATHRKIDVVEAPVWDCEGAAFLFDGRWPLVTSLQTTLHFWLQSHPDRHADKQWMKRFAAPVLAMEKQLMLESSGVRSISAAIRRDIEEGYGFRFREDAVRVAPLGMPPAAAAPAPAPASGRVTVLFVGRLEPRKGIDTLLAAIPRVLAENPQVDFRIVGDDSLPVPGGKASYKEAFLNSEAGKASRGRVHFGGRAGQQELVAAYAACDIFVAPSRFESFGLVFLEAMREGKPVIGCDVGGMPEIIEDGVNGLLVAPADSDALAAAILKLAASAPLRAEMGAAGRRIFAEKFTSERMAGASVGLYAMARQNFEAAHA